MTRGHAEALFPMIDAVLSRCGLGHGDIALLAVCTGPGSFTGVRVGVAAVRGLSLALGVPAYGLTRFEALAAQNGDGAVAVPGRGDTHLVQTFDGGAAVGEIEIRQGRIEDAAIDVASLARLAADRASGRVSPNRPAPTYVFEADAALPSEPPVRILDPLP